MIYAVDFTRMNFHFQPALEEKVVVIVETDIPFEDEHLEQFEDVVWEALWKQYPTWSCPYHQGNPAPNTFEKIRHSFSSASQGKIRTLTGLNFV